MEKKKLGTAYKLFAKAIESDNENVKDALETLLMITALTEGTDYSADPFDEMRKQIASLRQDLNKIQDRLEYTSYISPSPQFTSGGTSINDYEKLKHIHKIMWETPAPTGISFPKDKK